MQDEKTKESRIRYIHHKTASLVEDVSVQNNGAIGHERRKLTLTNQASDTVILEKSEDNVIQSLRLLHLNFKRITPAFFNEFTTVKRLELGCPVPVTWIFKYLPYLSNLTSLRFGQLAFGYEKDDDIEKMEGGFHVNNEVRLLELNYDVPHYNDLTAHSKLSYDNKIASVLELAKLYFPNLRECNLTIPKDIEPKLEDFLDAFPDIRGSGEKRAKYSEGLILFTNQRVIRRHSVETTTKKSSRNFAKRPHDDGGSSTSSSSSRTATGSSRDPRLGPKKFVLTKRECVDVDPDDDVICLDDGPSSSGIPPDYPSSGIPLDCPSNDSVRTRRHSPSLLGNK